MKHWHALWSQWTHRDFPAGPAAPPDWTQHQAQRWQSWLDAGRQWWTWWVAAAATPWLRQPWPHVGQMQEPASTAADAPAPPAPKTMRHRPPGTASKHAPVPHAEHKEHKSRHLQRRKINPG